MVDKVKVNIKKRTNAIKETKRKNISVEWKAIMKAVIKETIREIKKGIKRQQEDGLEKRIKTISTKREPFKEIRKLTGQGRRSCTDSTLMVDGKSVVGDREKAEKLAEWYAEIAKVREPENEEKEEIDRVYEKVRNAKSLIVFDQWNEALNPKEENLTWSEEMDSIKKRINNNKSSGFDGISNHILRKIPRFFWDCTCVIVNNCIANWYFLRRWKETTTIPIPKTGKAETTYDYRPISLFSNWGKCWRM